MTVEDLSIIAGLSVLSWMFSTFAFQFLRSEDTDDGRDDEHGKIFNWNKKIGILCFLLSIIFLNMLMYSMVLIAQNTSVSYLNDTVLVIGMEAVMWATIAGMALYLFAMTIFSFQFLHDVIMVWFKGRGKGSVP